MKIERLTIQACCGKTNILFKLDRPIAMTLLTFLVSKGFVEATQFTKSGLLYVDNPDFYLSGAFGSNKLNVKCKLKDCDLKLNELEELLLQME